jgi:hypothetical protein
MKIVFFLLSLCLTIQLWGQNETDLYRFSRTTYNGSARFEAMGGSFGALGADLSSSQINPAGYGRYSSSQFGMSIYGGANTNNATFNEKDVTSSKGFGGLSNIAVVITEDISKGTTGKLYHQFGLGMNRIENFKNTIRYSGQQYASLLDEFTSQAYGYEPQFLNVDFPFSSSLAYESYAMNWDPSTSSYYSLLNSGDVIHDRTVSSKGGQTELFLSYSFNYLNKLYIGANIGFRYHNYEENIDHTETLTDISGTTMRSFNYTYDLTTKGWGKNLKIGAIYLFSESFRVGLAIHTPNFGKLTDEWTANMTTTFDDSIKTIPVDLIPTGDYKYRIRSPFRAIGSLAYVFGTHGCLNLDVEALDYRHAHFKTTNDANYAPYNYEAENRYADSVFKPALNIRLGGELVIVSGIYLRGGVAYFGNAFKEAVDAEKSGDFIFSGGLGFKTKAFSADIAYKRRAMTKNYYAFADSFTKIASTTHQVIVSVALLF